MKITGSTIIGIFLVVLCLSLICSIIFRTDYMFSCHKYCNESYSWKSKTTDNWGHQIYIKCEKRDVYINTNDECTDKENWDYKCTTIECVER